MDQCSIPELGLRMSRGLRAMVSRMGKAWLDVPCLSPPHQVNRNAQEHDLDCAGQDERIFLTRVSRYHSIGKASEGRESIVR
jgi:hypothetical protein